MKTTNNIFIESLYKRSTYAQRMVVSLMLATGVAAGAASFAAPDQALAETIPPQDAVVAQQAGSTAEQAEEAVSGLAEFADYGLVGFEETTLYAHTNSNIATDTLDANGQTFGTNNVAEAEQSLIAHTDAGMTQVTTANGSTVLIGPDNEVTNADCPQSMMVNGSKVTCNGGTEGTLRQATEDEFPDFESWRDDACETSRALAELQDNVRYDDCNMNNRTVYANESGVSVVSVDAATLTKYDTEVHLRGVQDGTVVVNIDALGMDDLSLPSIIVNDENSRERATWSDFNAVLNIVDSTAEDAMYHGSVSFMGRVVGIVLAPFANVTAPHNIDGQIIASNITIGGEFHRDSYTGPGAADEEVPEPTAPQYPTITMAKLRMAPAPISAVVDEPEVVEEPGVLEESETLGADEGEAVTPENPGAPEVPNTPESNEVPDGEDTEEEPFASEEPDASEEPTDEETPDVPKFTFFPTAPRPVIDNPSDEPADEAEEDGVDSDAPENNIVTAEIQNEGESGKDTTENTPADENADEAPDTLEENALDEPESNDADEGDEETRAGEAVQPEEDATGEPDAEKPKPENPKAEEPELENLQPEYPTVVIRVTADHKATEHAANELMVEVANDAPHAMNEAETPEAPTSDTIVEQPVIVELDRITFEDTPEQASVKTAVAERADADIAMPAAAASASTSGMPQTGDAPMVAFAGLAALISACAAAFARLRTRRTGER